MKGAVSPAIWLLVILVVIMVSFIGIFAYTQYLAAIRPPLVPVEYDGEFKDGFVATKGWFTNDFTELGVGCNVTSDILGAKESGSCIYETIIEVNDTAVPSASSKDYEFAWVVDINGPVESMDVDFELKGDAKTYFTIRDAGIWTHEDNPVEILDLAPYIEDNEEIDATTRALDGDEYVIWIKLHSGDVGENFGDAETIGLLNLKLDTTEDVDEAYATLINEET